MGDTWAWVLFFLANTDIIWLVIFELRSLADLEFDYINPYDSASRINRVVIPEIIAQGVLTIHFPLMGHWFKALLGIPHLYYNVRLLNTRREFVIDFMEISNSLNWEKKKRLLKLGYFVLFLFMTIFWLIYSS